EGVGVLREAASRCDKQATVARVLGQQALGELQAERRGCAHEVRVVVHGKGAAAGRKRVAHVFEGVLLQRATAERRDDRHGDNRFHRRLVSAARTWTWSGSAA